MAGVVIAAVLLLAAYGFSWLQKAVYRGSWNKNLAYSLRSSSNAVFEGEKVVFTESLTNGKRLPLPWVYVSYTMSRFLVFLDAVNRRIDRGERRSLVYIVGMIKTATRKSTVLCSKRGHYTATGFSMAGNNLLMTNFAEKSGKLEFEMLVYPRLVDYPEAVIPFRRMIGDSTTRRFTDPDPFTFKGIREYQPFDSFRQINWGATARTGALMSNIYDFSVNSDITILLNLQSYCSFERDHVFEEAIRLAAFFCRKCIGAGIPVSLVCPAGDGKPTRISDGMSGSHLETIYAALAYIDLSKWNESLADHFPPDPEKALVLISPYHGEDIREKFMSVRMRSAGAFWIIPHCAQDEIRIATGGDIIAWEVGDDA